MTQNKGWVLSDYKKAFEKFKEENGDYPNTKQIDSCSYLPASRTIQRQFGGVVQLKKKLGITEIDHRTGERRSLTASIGAARNQDSEIKMLIELKKYYSDIQIHREGYYSDTANTRSDFCIHNPSGKFFIDVFYPADVDSLQGCVNWKMGRVPTKFSDPVYFVVMNEKITQDVIENVIASKRKPIKDFMRVVSFATFKNMLAGREV